MIDLLSSLVVTLGHIRMALRQRWCALRHTDGALTNVTPMVVCQTCGIWRRDPTLYERLVSDATTHRGGPSRDRADDEWVRGRLADGE